MASRTASRSTTSKPYDRPTPSSSKGKGKATGVNIGAPSTLGQASRKGKKAWRKNIDITELEEGLERAREEERVTGGLVVNKSNAELFTVDVVGDAEVGKKARRTHKPLRSLAVLHERSAVPSLTSKPITSTTTAEKQRNKKLSHAEKERLRRISRRTVVDPDSTTIVSSADIKGTTIDKPYDAWTAEERVVVPIVKGGFGEETIIKRKPKAPITIQRQRELYLSSQVESGRELLQPEGGTSYNPSAESHSKLIDEAYQEELELIKKEEEIERAIAERGGAVESRKGMFASEFAEGMKVARGDGFNSDDEESDDEDEEVNGQIVKKVSKRKTTAQRNKALRHKLAQEAIQAEKAAKKLHKSISSIQAFKRDLLQKQKEEEEKKRLAALAKKERERLGLQGGEKVGKHRVKKGKVDVQLGEDLAESLRQIKPSGNLFKDRFLALQKRALIEPRVPQMPRRKTTRVKEYEAHSYKRFQ